MCTLKSPNCGGCPLKDICQESIISKLQEQLCAPLSPPTVEAALSKISARNPLFLSYRSYSPPTARYPPFLPVDEVLSLPAMYEYPSNKIAYVIIKFFWLFYLFSIVRHTLVRKVTSGTSRTLATYVPGKSNTAQIGWVKYSP